MYELWYDHVGVIALRAICVHDHVGDVVVNTAACRGLAGGVASINCGVSINWVPVEVPYGYHTEAQ